jgi:CO/xanthine dehydrogenase FAD-binding subunit
VTATYAAATSVADALEALAAGARPIAGGTDLVVGHRSGKAPLPQNLVAIHELDELKQLADNGSDGLALGALVNHATIVASGRIRDEYTALADASAIVGSHATRNAGTIGGNVMNASPAMETGGPLMCLGATVTLRSKTGERTVAVDELFTAPGRTIAEPDEMLVAVTLPPQPPATGSCYVRLEYRRQMEIAIVGATAAVTLDGPEITSARVAITALAPTIRRVPEAEAALVGSDGGAEAVAAAAQAASDASRPISDVRGTEAYRRAMAAVITRRAVTAAIARANGTTIPIPASPALHGATE